MKREPLPLFAGVVGRGRLDVDDGAVVWVVGSDREVNLADEFFVGAGQAERSAPENVLAVVDLDGGDPGLGDRGEGERQKGGDE
jgi:hypothetical protein